MDDEQIPATKMWRLFDPIHQQLSLMSFSENLRPFTRFNAASPMRDCTPCLPVPSVKPERPSMSGKRRQALTPASDSSITRWRSIGVHWLCWPRPKLNASNPRGRDRMPAGRTGSADFLEKMSVTASRVSSAAEYGSKQQANELRIALRSAGNSHELAPPHSITSSARISSVGGMVIPSALAVWRLIMMLNLVGRSIGSSPGFAPFKILSTKAAAR